jgi:hypothetical protein
MDFLITAGAFKKPGAEAYRAEEDRVLDELRAEGVVSAAYRRTDGAGVLGIAHGPDLASGLAAPSSAKTTIMITAA